MYAMGGGDWTQMPRSGPCGRGIDAVKMLLAYRPEFRKKIPH